MDFTVTLSREEVRSKLTLRERKKRKKSHYDEEEWQRNLRSINSLPQLRKQFYKDHLPKSLLGTNKLDIYHPFCRFDRWGFEIPTQSGDIEPSDDDHDDDDQLRKFDVETERTSFACPMPQDASEPAKQPDDAEGTPPLPENHQRLEGLVDATLLAILCGRRHISYDLITGPGSATLLPGSYITQANPRTFPDAV
ncbi:hypothetical protein ASPCAL13698 [Aspergillus calidoustus]|uniref:Uncharacterized protein n=1 Tax=Aspergillus calidoustus TaxID=454130 RepID=A0A0U4ZLX0_ASPCI|nr:hypothetical protein ASPCAL13698 [Aspergillus calidoustus]